MGSKVICCLDEILLYRSNKMFWYVDWILLWNLVVKYILLFWVLYGFWFIVVVLMIVVVNNKNVGIYNVGRWS